MWHARPIAGPVLLVKVVEMRLLRYGVTWSHSRDALL